MSTLSNYLESKSRFMSTVLRHKPELANLILDKEGYCETTELCKSLKISQQDLEKIVISNEKQRFSFNNDKTKIRAAQGHSVKTVSVTFEKVDPPSELFHGTKEEFLSSILKNGLIKGTRHHVHLSDNEKTAQIVADRRKGKSIILKIDSMFMRAEGINFYKSENGVFLTDFIDPKYIFVK